MAQGNDAAQAAAELATREGVELNAEKIIKESIARYPAELKAASLMDVNQEATDSLDLEAVEKIAPGPVVSATVRGTDNPQVVYAYDVGGDIRKGVVALADLGGGGARKPAAKPAAKKPAARRRTAAKK